MDAITRTHYRRGSASLVEGRMSVAMIVGEDGTRVVLAAGTA
ncbi:MAG: hypothetical protein ABW318_11095 [Vicinamibacterales bacterium]|jgi:hypothetical protein